MAISKYKPSYQAKNVHALKVPKERGWGKEEKRKGNYQPKEMSGLPRFYLMEKQNKVDF